MIFPELNQSRDAILSSVAAALEDENAAIYVDASVLIRCYELNTKARDDLLSTFRLVGSRLRIPIWAGWETWRYGEGSKPENPLSKPGEDVKKKLAAFSSEIRRKMEDGDEPHRTADGLLREVERIETAFNALAQEVSGQRRHPERTSELLFPLINGATLASNLPAILKRVNDEANLRFTHYVPPGSGDESKGANKFGDLIIWLEILSNLARERNKRFVLVTDDVTKGDWVHKPRMLLDNQGRPNRNESITIAHPMLVSEAKRECPDLDEVHIISLDEYAQVMSSKLGVAIPSLTNALQKVD
ncbi:MAG: PIN-like domain-containing protein, partial [Sphingomicrobium sp.]